MTSPVIQNDVQPLMVNTNEAAAMMGVSVTTLHYLMKNGDLPRTKLGRRTLIRVADIHKFLDGLKGDAPLTGSIRPKHHSEI